MPADNHHYYLGIHWFIFFIYSHIHECINHTLKKNFFLTRGQLFYNITLASAMQHESAISTHVSPPVWPSPRPTPLGCQSTTLRSCVIRQLPTAVCFTHGNAYVSTLLSQFVPLSPSPTVSKVCSLCLHHSFILQKLNQIIEFCSLFYLTVYIYYHFCLNIDLHGNFNGYILFIESYIVYLTNSHFWTFIIFLKGSNRYVMVKIVVLNLDFPCSDVSSATHGWIILRKFLNHSFSGFPHR